ncbi:Laccase-2 [Psilocybe cubensis]|uniref:Laccase n=2 Tax=Psilocybe cubensis TaxID=181762 RepID=A0A8H7XRD4_PSICU|nr:Laccase-2 [Psilocybe cubensis]KAH9479059.1 Laccase-2 [Psilocybe cubensis]
MRLLSSLIGLSYTLGAFSSVILDGRDGARDEDAGAIGPDADLYIGNKAISPDGFTRSAVLAGSSMDSLSFPGPVITATKGDTFHLNVIDELKDPSMMMSTSVHWHGFFQKRSSWADGVSGVTQCPIAPGHSFMYEFSTGDQTGTYWYHSHFSTQYCDGLRGAIVVYDPEDPHKDLYDFDDESTIITLADWYHAVAPITQRSVIPIFNSTLINGLGRYAGGPASPLAVIKVLPNKRYRFRLVSVSCSPNYIFSIDGHPMTIVEADSVNVKPFVVDQVQIFAGQRYSFILDTKMPVGNYWMRALPNIGDVTFKGGVNSAILRYIGAPEADPITLPSKGVLLKETDLHPLENPAAPGAPGRGKADVNINLDIEWSMKTQKFYVNNASYESPSVPVLLQIMSGKETAQELLPAGSVYVLPPNKVIEISMPGGSGGSPHPIHLHGQSFSVIRSANSSIYNYENPVRRDVVSIGDTAMDNVTIRFTTDNAGPWFMHCHIDWHLERGLSVVFANDAPAIEDSKPPPKSWDELCPIYNALTPQKFN